MKTTRYDLSSSSRIYYNEFINLSEYAMIFGGAGNKGLNTQVLNNTFYNINNLTDAYLNVITFQNNIFSNCYGTLFQPYTTPSADYNCYYKVANIGTSNTGSHSIQADPMFNNVSSLLFDLESVSPCIGAGIKIWPSYKDIDGNIVPIGTTVDIGAHEYDSSTNSACLVSLVPGT
jgi:hypothetical protein